MYREINFSCIVDTLSRLENRISERFSDRGILGVCHELLEFANETDSNLLLINRPNYFLRIFVALIIIVSLLALAYSATIFEVREEGITLTEVIQIAEAAINDLVLIVLALFFLVSLESRVKRAKVIKSLNQLRAIVHVIDMHQLTKDPSELTESHRTPSSPVRDLNRYSLQRYLDYCSEMLAIIGKIAAVYAQHIPEPQVLSSVNEIENLTSGLSRKIWQKIIILNTPLPFEKN
ncbi:hypothetical protein [Aliikangiella sp. G2MR2-5]|uniref:hypothetical protein n=1 Tax=Aliikangiella sp. G2MR2-5 TaxID=2788943 RepID=UPI0018A8A4D6|nr:hypothetical protein [Aliikangiella sp. G2MR2-5]